MSTRRAFLRQALQSVVGAFLAGTGLACRAGEMRTVQPLDVIDCHTHFYDPTRPQGIPWPGPGSPLYRQALPRQLRALPHARRVTGTVVVEASPWLEDNQWLLDLARDDPFVVGIVGRLDPGHEEFAAQLGRFARDRIFRGIRVGGSAVSEFLESGELTNFGLLEKHDLELDVNGGPNMPLVVSRLAERLPSLRIVVNHIGNVGIDQNPPPADWVGAIRAAASHPMVYCKVSALLSAAARGGREPPVDVAFYRPYLDVLWEAFGEDRLIYGSDWPVCEMASDYQTQQQVVLDYVADLGDSAMRKFFSLNSQQAYKWTEREGRLA